MNREVGLGSHCLFHSFPVPNKPYGFCGRSYKTPRKKRKIAVSYEAYRFIQSRAGCCLLIVIYCIQVKIMDIGYRWENSRESHVSRGHCLEVAIDVRGKSWTLSGGNYRSSW